MKTRLFSFICCFLVALTIQAVDTLPFTLVNNSDYSDSEIYIGLVGKQNGSSVWVDFSTNAESATQVRPINSSYNTIHKNDADWGYANIFVPLSSITNKVLHLPKITACRIFFAFKTPMYIHFFDDGGYAGADLQNPSDPNHGIRWELVEFSWADNGLWVNTSRVDAYQYPMGVELWGAAGANNAYMKAGELMSHQDILDKFRTEMKDSPFAACYTESGFEGDKHKGIIMQPSKISAFKEGGAAENYFKDYIDRIWSAFTSKQLVANQGERGIWRGGVSGESLTMVGEFGAFNGVTATVPYKPTTQDVIEGKGALATGSEQDKALQAQLCGAISRGVVDVNVASGVEQNWGDASKFFVTDVHNRYVAFFHQTDVSYDGKTYAFAYDDTFDQSSTLVTSIPEKVQVTIGGFVGNPNQDVVPPAIEDPEVPQDPNPGGGNQDDNEQGDEEGNGNNNNEGGDAAIGQVANVQYNYSFVPSGNSVLVTFTCTNPNEIVGLVPVIFNKTGGGFEETIGSGNTISIAIPANPGDKIVVAAKFMFAGGDAITPDYTYEMPISTDILVQSAVMQVYPTSTAAWLHVTNAPENSYQISDLLGVVKLTGCDFPIYVGDLNRGYYFLRIGTKYIKFFKQ